MMNPIIETKQFDDILVINIQENRLDAKISIEFKTKMIDLIKRGHYHIILNLSNVKFIDSTGLGAIISSLKVLGNKGDIVLCGVQSAAMTLLKLTRMDQVFRIYADEEEAIASFA